MSRKNDEEPSILKGLLALGAGALAVGLVGAFIANEQPVEVPQRPRESRPNEIRREKATVKEIPIDELENWLSQNEAASKPRVIEETPISSDMLCKICFEEKVSHVLQCGHTICQACAVRCLKISPLCPFDRSRLTQAPRKLYF